MTSSFKQRVYSHCLELLDEKIQHLQKNLRELKEGTENDTKSSAGDKHETSQAMMQLEFEKISRILDELQRQKNELEKIDINLVSGKIKPGSLINTNNGCLFVSAAIGKIMVDNVPVMVISMLSPVAVKLIGQQEGGIVQINGMEYRVQSLE